MRFMQSLRGIESRLESSSAESALPAAAAWDSPENKLNDATDPSPEYLRPVCGGAWISSLHFSEKVRVRSGIAKGGRNDPAVSLGVLQLRNEVLGFTRDYLCDESLRQLCDSCFGCV